jgi:signal transduction histidine kinase
MRMLVTVVWKIIARLLRRLGWGVLLVPVAALGIALFGVGLWTVTAVALALVLAIRLPPVAAGLLPVTMVGMGICGLVVAASVQGTRATLAGPPVTMFMLPPVGWVSGPGMLSWGTPVADPRSLGAVRVIAGPGRASHWQTLVLPWRPASAELARRAAQARRAAAARATHHTATHVAGIHGPGVWPGRLLVPVALLLLTAGLLLAPRTIAWVRAHAARMAPYLRRRMWESRWGILLVPVAAIGIPVFGVRSWTVAAVVAALIVAVQWPAIAADLVPVALTGFAICGFVLAVSWQSLAAHSPALLYGGGLVASRQTALLAGAEASAFVAFAAWLFPRTIGAHARALLTPGPDPELAGRVQRLTETRGHAIDTATSELRRIERDLHDGAQARLVALGMNLRAVERMLPASPETALALVVEARETSVRALKDLRDLIRGIYPPVLADRGLGHAVRALALDTPMPTELDIDLPGRLAAPVESACYFAVAEALTNAVRHSGARRAHIRIQHAAGLLRIEVTDDGTGGADPASGTGLRGVERRLGTFDGILAVSSPPGGPTMIVMEVPCALLSPKTCSC